MPKAIYVASGTADAQAVSGASTLAGWSVRESAASAAAASVTLRNGTNSASPAVALIELAADASQAVSVPAVDCPDGVFVDRVAGTTEVVLYVM